MKAMEAVEAKAKGQKRKSLDSMVAAANADLPPGARKIAASTVRDVVRSGAAGVSPKKRGPEFAVPEVVTDAAGSWARVGQVSGDEKTNTRLGQQMVAAVTGTDTEGTFTVRGANAALKKRRVDRAGSLRRPRRGPRRGGGGASSSFRAPSCCGGLFGDTSSRAPHPHGRALRRHKATR